MSEYNMNYGNPFISNVERTQTDKESLYVALLTVGSVCKGKYDNLAQVVKDWLKGKTSLFGGRGEDDYRLFINLLIQNKENPTILNHPYINALNRILISGTTTDMYTAFIEDPSSKETFNMKEYIDTICIRDKEGKIVDFKKSILEGKYDNEISEQIFDSADNYISAVKKSYNKTEENIRRK